MSKIKSHWVKNSLGYDSKLMIYQDKSMFNYSIDTLLLANFASINANTKKVLEIGTNNGALAIFLSERYSKMIIEAIEIQPQALELAEVNVKMNAKEKQIQLINDDFNHYYQKLQKNNVKYDLIICNPPFYQVQSSIKKHGQEKLWIATHEIKLTLEQIIHGSSKILRQKGFLSLVVPTQRFVDVCVWMRKYQFEVKKVQFIHPRVSDKSNLVLIEGRYQVGAGTNFLPNIYLHPEDSKNHQYLPEVKALHKPIVYNRRYNHIDKFKELP